MKITIWEQFSSNHSTAYDIIGTFDSVEKAEEIADKMREWLTAIIFPEEETSDITLTEIYLAEKYDIEWNEDGLRWNGKPDSMDEVILRWKNLVIFACPLESHEYTAFPYIELFCKLGAKQVQSFFGSWQEIGFDLSCVAPNDKVGNELREYILNELKKPFPQQKFMWAKNKYQRWACLIEHISFENVSLNIKGIAFHAEDLLIFLNYLEQNEFMDIKFTLTDKSPRAQYIDSVKKCE